MICFRGIIYTMKGDVMSMETKTLYYAHTDKKAYQNLVKEIITRGKIASKDEREYYYYFFYETDFGAFRLLVDKSNRIAYTITAFVNTWNNIFASGVI